MILQSLVRYYDTLAANGEISPAGWSTAKVSLALRLAPDGTPLGMASLKVTPKNGKKEIPQVLTVPEQVKRAVNISANFLCDNGSYMLAIDDKGKPERTKKCFEAAKELHHAVLDGVESEAAKAVLAFFDTWDIDTAAENEQLADYLDEIKAGGNVIFQMDDGNYAQEDSAVRAAWEKYHTHASPDAVIMRCLVTGEEAPIARLHPNIKGISGAQSSGASLVSYNAYAFESYGHEDKRDGTGQGQNAPVSEAAAFKYGTALNYMIADREHVQHIADTTVLCWAEDAEPVEQDIWMASVYGSNEIDQQTLDGIVKALAGGGTTKFQDKEIRYDNPFYVLGLAPNASRLSVRFFLQNEFGKMLENLHKHQERLEIVQPMGEKHALPLWHLLNETANQNSKNKTPPAPMAGAVLTAILMGTDYPASLFEAVMLRIRAEHDINWRKAAILKAYFLKNKGITIPKEVFQVELNKDSSCTPYVLGRLFAVLERVQTTATPGIKATIRDKYFTSASATPAAIFPLLLSLSQHHQRKLTEGSKVYFDKIITELENRIHTTLPTRFSLQEQGAFYLGYYHEKQALYTSKKGDVKTENSTTGEDE